MQAQTTQCTCAQVAQSTAAKQARSKLTGQRTWSRGLIVGVDFIFAN